MASIPAPASSALPEISASVSASPIALTRAIEYSRRADEVVRALIDARERANVLGALRLELVFPGPRDARAVTSRKKALRKVTVQFMERVPATRRGNKHALVVQLSPAGSTDVKPLRLRVDINPSQAKDERIAIGVIVHSLRTSANAEQEELLTSTSVLTHFELGAENENDVDETDEAVVVGLSGVQGLGPMVAELQHVWFHERARSAKPHNVDFGASGDLSKYWVSSASDESWQTWQPQLTGQLNQEICEEAGHFLAALVIWRCLAALYVGDESRRPLRQRAGLPESEEFFPKRPVDLNPSDVRAHLAQRKLRVPWHVIEAACTSLNAGKHVIFTGPPGCGKTELAVELAHFATRRERDGLLVTASPAWSASELIGRYMPRQASYGLDFNPGFFLRAIRDRRWLIIDEFNRAPIDACFGELFTVLAGQPVELPFDEPQPSGGSARVRVLPGGRDAATRAAEPEARAYSDYVVPTEFRIIGTMNDADRSELSRMSFALLRRFDIIRVDAPDAEELILVINDAMAASKLQTDLTDRGYSFPAARSGTATVFDSLADVLYDIFIGEASKGSEQRRGGLVSARVVGVATCRDVIAFVAEGLRAPVPPGPGDEKARRCAFKRGDEAEDRYHPRHLARSYLAMAIVLKVFPQLEALDADQRYSVIKRLTRIFADSTFLRIEPVKEADADDCRFEIVDVVAPHSDLDGDGVLSIAEYLIDEMRNQLRGTGEEHRYSDLISEVKGGGSKEPS